MSEIMIMNRKLVIPLVKQHRVNLIRLLLVGLWVAALSVLRYPDETRIIYFLPLLSLVTLFLLDLFSAVICALLTSAIVMMVMPGETQLALLGVFWASLLLIFVLRHNTEPEYETARENVQESSTEIAAAREVKARFATHINHELRTPINLILGFSEAMLSDTSFQRVALPARYREDVEAIYRNGRILQNMIDDLVNLTRLDVDILASKSDTADPETVIGEAAALTRDLVGDTESQVEIQIVGSLPSMKLHRTFFRQMLLNLMQYTVRAHGYVVVHAQAEQNYLRLTVGTATTLSGMSQSLTPEESTALSFCTQFVAAAQGKIWAEIGADKTRTICISLPLESKHAHVLPLVMDAPAIIILNENRNVINLFRQHMIDFQVIGVSSTEDVRKLHTANKPSAVIIASDSMQPTLDELNRIVGDGVLSITCLMPSLGQILQKYDHVEHLIKPIDYNALSAVVKRWQINPANILIVDDNHDIVQLFSHMLGSIAPSAQLWKAYSGREGLALLTEQPLDLIIMDLQLPDTDGLNLIQAVRDEPQFSKTPILLISGKQAVDLAPVRKERTLTIHDPAGIQSHKLVRGIGAMINRYHAD
jgi:signal transduction histidine kinase/CheY-like chemotaxis protein